MPATGGPGQSQIDRQGWLTQPDPGWLSEPGSRWLTQPDPGWLS